MSLIGFRSRKLAAGQANRLQDKQDKQDSLKEEQNRLQDEQDKL
jgi:hypothetical protein